MRPSKLTLEEVFYIKTERLPTLLARLDAPNGFRWHYQDYDELPRLFDFFSADYTAEKLRHFSQAFLEDGAGEAILSRLDYLTPEQKASSLTTIRGPVHWPTTIQHWLNWPAETGLRHEWSHAPKDFATLPNLLFSRFQLELARELAQLVRFVELGGPASVRLQTTLPNLKERAARHLALCQAPLLPSVQLALAWNRHDPATLPLLATECKRAANFNPAYARLNELWHDFTSRYVSLPQDETDLARSGLPPMSKIYELWAACEVANALNLNFRSTEIFEAKTVLTAEGAVFCSPDEQIKLYYNKGLPGGWYSTTRPGLPRPDLRLEVGGRQIFLDVKYRTGSDERARPDDIYKMLAYMHDFEVKTGVIIFPGQQAGTKALAIENEQGQRLVELALRPPQSEENDQFGVRLGQLLAKNLFS